MYHHTSYNTPQNIFWFHWHLNPDIVITYCNNNVRTYLHYFLRTVIIYLIMYKSKRKMLLLHVKIFIFFV